LIVLDALLAFAAEPATLPTGLAPPAGPSGSLTAKLTVRRAAGEKEEDPMTKLQLIKDRVAKAAELEQEI
jgi:hypothetical protein